MPITPTRRVPGEVGVWVLILGELFIFSAFFIVIANTRNADPDLFAQSQSTLNHGIGLVNTLLLLTSSLAVALGWQRVQADQPHPERFFLVALILGIGFAVMKALEYCEKIEVGIDLLTNDFFLFYFIFTGIHLMHVLAGIGFLALMAHTAKQGLAAAHSTWIECGALFWHLVDLLWIVLFGLFYLVN